MFSGRLIAKHLFHGISIIMRPENKWFVPVGMRKKTNFVLKGPVGNVAMW